MLCFFSSCVSTDRHTAHFPIKVKEGAVRMQVTLIPLTSYSDVGRGYHAYERAVRTYQKVFFPKTIPVQEEHTVSPIIFSDPRDTRYKESGEIPAKRNEVECVVTEITEGNALQWYIPRNFKAEVTIINPYVQTALCECSNKIFYLKQNEKKVLYVYP